MNGTSTDIGTGIFNTEANVRIYGYKDSEVSKTDYAAKICSDLEFGGYDD